MAWGNYRSYIRRWCPIFNLNLPKDLECCICQVGAIFNPKECVSCEKIFCEYCINRCVRKGRNGNEMIQCPSCKQIPIKLKKNTNKTLMSLLSQQMVPAHECCFPHAPKVTYEVLLIHLMKGCACMCKFYALSAMRNWSKGMPSLSTLNNAGSLCKSAPSVNSCTVSLPPMIAFLRWRRNLEGLKDYSNWLKMTFKWRLRS